MLALWNYFGSIGMGFIDREFFYNSDSLNLPALAVYLFKKKGVLSDWRMSPAIYLFPDMVIYFSIFKIFPHIHLDIWLFALVQVILSVVTLIWFYAFFKIPKREALVGPIALCAILSRLPISIEYNYWIQSAFHYGSYLCTLWLLGLVLKEIKDGRSKQNLGVFFLISALTLLSDQILILQFFIPLLMTYALLGYLNIIDRSFAKQKIFFSLVVGGVSYSLYKLVSIFTVYYGLKAHSYWYFENLKFFSQRNYLFLAVYVIFISLCAYSLKKRRHSPEKCFFVTFLVISTALTLLVLPSQEGAPLRYAINALYAPIFFGIIIIGFSFSRKVSLVFTIALVIGAFVLSINKAQPIQAISNLKEYYPDDIRCLDAGLSDIKSPQGISGYWEAKRTSYLSKNNINMTQMDMDKFVYRDWISAKPEPNTIFKFIIAKPMYLKQHDRTKAQLKYIFGDPEKEISCNLFEALVYKYGHINDVLKALHDNNELEK